MLQPERDGSWGAFVPDLPGCVGGGDTPLEAFLQMLEDAKLGWLTSCLKHGDPIPEPERPARLRTRLNLIALSAA